MFYQRIVWLNQASMTEFNISYTHTTLLVIKRYAKIFKYFFHYLDLFWDEKQSYLDVLNFLYISFFYKA